MAKVSPGLKNQRKQKSDQLEAVKALILTEPHKVGPSELLILMIDGFRHKMTCFDDNCQQDQIVASAIQEVERRLKAYETMPSGSMW